MLRAGVLTLVVLIPVAAGIWLGPSTSGGTTNVDAAPGGIVSGAAIAGDADCSGEVNSIDALLILQFDASLTPSLPCLVAADANKDGGVDSIDAALVLQYELCLVCGPT